MPVAFHMALKIVRNLRSTSLFCSDEWGVRGRKDGALRLKLFFGGRVIEVSVVFRVVSFDRGSNLLQQSLELIDDCFSGSELSWER